MDDHDFEFFQEANLITAAYCQLKGWKLPSMCEGFSEEQLAPMRERIQAEMNPATDALRAYREKIG